MRLLRALLIVLLAALLPVSAGAVQPGEMLEDPALEARARGISKEIRCLVCQNESIDESNADLARDLRVLIRERLVAGDTDEQVRQFLVDRYGEYVLLRPTFTGANMVIWLLGPALLILGGVAAVVFIRNRRPPEKAAPQKLSAEEEARLAKLLEEEQGGA